MSKFASPVFALLAFAAFTLAAMALGACSRASSSLFVESASTATAAGHAPQIQVLHGDVMVIDGRHVRLADATTPQASPGAHCPAEAIASRQAQLRLQALSRGVRSATITPTGVVDDHGRTWAHVVLDGVDPAQTLINEGLAVAPQQRGFDWCAAASTTQPAAEHIALLSYAG
jgi:endonuclease YncB( thermonuclease family)